MLEVNEHRREVRISFIHRYYSSMCRSFMNINEFFLVYKFMDGDGIFMGSKLLREDMI